MAVKTTKGEAKTKAPGKTKIDPNESKADRFKRLAIGRTKKTLLLIKNIGNCSNKNVYQYKDEDVKKIFKTLGDALAASEAKYEEVKKSSAVVDFNL